MSYTFVVPDIHGRFDLLELAIEKIMKHSVSGTVIFTGDYVDRGPQSREVIATLVRGPSIGWNWICLKGNHETMFEECVHGHEISWWKKNGGRETLASYENHQAEMLKHLSWIKSLPFLHSDQYRVYVHAGVSETYELSDQPEAMTQWYRYPHRADIGYRDLHVVHGHTAMVDGPELYKNRTNLDTWAVGSGYLTIGVFDDDKPGGPVEILTVSNPNITH